MEQSKQLDVSGGSITFESRPSPRFTFTNNKFEKPTKLISHGIVKLVRSLGDAGKQMKEMSAHLEEHPTEIIPDKIFYSSVLSTHGLQQVRLECNTYNNKPYLFLKRYFKAMKPYTPAANGVSSDENLFLHEKLLLQKALVQSTTTLSPLPKEEEVYPKWVNCRGSFRIEPSDIEEIKTFVINTLTFD